MMNQFNEITNLAIKSAIEAGKILEEGFGTNFQIYSKEGRNNLVTEFDKKSENYIIDSILKIFPNHSILAEESGKSKSFNSDEILWVIDPLDGTVNFAHNLPIFSVSIAAVKNNEIISGIIYHPILKELFVAEKNNGSYLNNKKIQVSKSNNLESSFLVTGFPYDLEIQNSNYLDIFKNFVSMGIPVRRLGSAALDLAYVANGRFDGFWELNLKPWDVAAGILIVQEAGGTVTQFDGTTSGIYDNSILATNNHLHKSILKEINSIWISK